MKLSYTLALSASALALSLSAAAMASDIAAGTYYTTGYVTQSTCGSLAASLKVGAPSISSVYYGGAGKVMSLLSAGNSSTSKPGSAATNSCIATSPTPSAGLNNSKLTFNCYGDTVSGPASSSNAQLQTTFKVGKSHVAGGASVTTTATVLVGGSPLCSFTTDGTYSAY
jgi:hypothetical protein